MFYMRRLTPSQKWQPHRTAVKGATIYVTSSPCIECAKLIIQSGIKRVVYSENYRIADGCELLKRAGIIVDYIDLNE